MAFIAPFNACRVHASVFVSLHIFNANIRIEWLLLLHHVRLKQFAFVIRMDRTEMSENARLSGVVAVVASKRAKN